MVTDTTGRTSRTSVHSTAADIAGVLFVVVNSENLLR